ncbi:translation initiation factor eIF2B subunit gamma-like [Babylonia areolata]|uniref:translation initiation factor eIF2B subunit gamma-like n=1 Tax=Babylonia areolata TaxID=304850 RepID=UPI003FD1B400
MEFMPVVLAAGLGSKVNKLTKLNPKALLPVGNFPTVYYPLAMLERHGFTEAIVVTPSSFEDDMRKTLLDKCGIKMKLIFESIADTQLEEHGTAQALRLVRPKIPDNTDVLVVGCDFITDLNLNHVFSLFHKTDASVTMLLSSIKESRDLPIPGLDKAKQEKEKRANRDVFGISEDSGRVIIMEGMNKAEDDTELDPKIFLKYPKVRVRTTMTDCHLYIFKRWVIDYLATHKDCEKMSSLKYDLLPYLVKKQFPSEVRLRKSRTWQKTPAEDEAPVRLLPVSKEHDIYAFAEIPAALHVSKTTMDWAAAMSAGMTTGGNRGIDLHENDVFHVTRDNDVIRCYAYIQDSGFCVRTNTISGYCEANSQIIRIFPTVAPENKSHLIHPSVKVPRSTQVGPDCFIGEKSQVGEKVVMKKSAVGADSMLKDKAKVSNSVIMDQVEIGESCMVMNSIICSGAVLAEKCEIKDSIVSPSTSIQSHSKHTNELVSDGDRMLE